MGNQSGDAFLVQPKQCEHVVCDETPTMCLMFEPPEVVQPGR